MLLYLVFFMVGPLLFSLFVNLLPKWLTRVKSLINIDDINIFYKISSPSDSILLQSELNIFSKWVSHLGLSLNITKCHVTSFP